MIGTARIAHLDYELPAEAVSDADLAARLGCEPELVAQLGRGRGRYISPDGEGPSHLATRAARRVLEKAGLTPSDVDLIVFSTNTADFHFPGSAVLVQDQLACGTVGCLDVRSQCTGFLTGIETARRFVMTGSYSNVLVAAGDVYSHMMRMDGKDPELGCLAADGVAVALVQPGEGGDEVLSVHVRTDGRRHQEFWCEYPAGRNWISPAIGDRIRFLPEHFEAGLHFPSADFAAMRSTALEKVPGSFSKALAGAGVDRVDATLVAHLNPDIEAELSASLGDAAGTVLCPDLVYLGAGALPVLLARAASDGRLDGVETVALVTCGSGASWGTAVLRRGA